MALLLGLDLGTTKTCALALEAGARAVIAVGHADTPGAAPGAAALGRREFEAEGLFDAALAALRACVERLGERAPEVAGMAVTGQQHGGLLVGPGPRALTPFINWQDGRGAEVGPDGRTWLEGAAERLGPEAWRVTGCRLASGYLGLTLFRLARQGGVPDGARACFLTDYVAARLAGAEPVTDATMAASSGLLDVRRRAWSAPLVEALGLPACLLPPIREAGSPLGRLAPEWARATGLPAGLPLFVGVGDNQAGFLGSVPAADGTELVNVGTGSQVARYSSEAPPPEADLAPELELRPYPRGGVLAVHAEVSGGRAYAALHRLVVRLLAAFGAEAEPGAVYAGIEALALAAPPGSGGLRCDPRLAGSRSEPGRRGSLAGIDEANLEPGCLVRAALEGMAGSLHRGSRLLAALLGSDPAWLVGAGNGIRRNRALVACLERAYGLPLEAPPWTEEAAVGAAMVAGWGLAQGGDGA